uniref:Uncharacterized protein n=1 Tax=Haemonchus contortus TaxID=6289 RepID=W6ND15_HAECO
MANADQVDVASVVARAITDIAILGSKQHREMCLKVSGSRSMADLYIRLEQSLNRFLRSDDKETGWSVPTKVRRYSCNSFSRSFSQKPKKDTVSEHVTAGDFSSADEDVPGRIPRATAAQGTAGDFSSADEDVPGGILCTTAAQDEVFYTPPDSQQIIDRSAFSPELSSYSSTIDPTTDSYTTFSASDFSCDEFSEEERRLPPLVRRFSNGLKMQGQPPEHGAVTVPSSSAKITAQNLEQVDEFSD